MARPRLLNSKEDVAAHLAVLERLRNAAVKSELPGGVVWDRTETS